MRMLGVDYGTVRIGLALSDPMGMLATPLEVLPASQGHQKNAAAIVRICQEKEVQRIVMGWPLHMNGDAGALTPQIAKFIEVIQSLSEIPVVTWDERMTTVTAQQGLRGAGASRKRSKQMVDAIAAQVLLQHYLDSM